MKVYTLPNFKNKKKNENRKKNIYIYINDMKLNYYFIKLKDMKFLQYDFNRLLGSKHIL